MRQRVAIAIALLHGPSLIIADEPTTALDVTIQAQILAEVQELCAELGTALVWITHDLAVVAGLADRVAVMYAGRIVETGPVDAVLDAPAPSLYARPDRLRPEPQQARRAAGADPRHDAVARAAAGGLRLRAALPRASMPPAACRARADDGIGRSAPGAASTPCRRKTPPHEQADHRNRGRLQALREARRLCRQDRAT